VLQEKNLDQTSRASCLEICCIVPLRGGVDPPGGDRRQRAAIHLPALRTRRGTEEPRRLQADAG
jgi:hypothetical protein